MYGYEFIALHGILLLAYTTKTFIINWFKYQIVQHDDLWLENSFRKKGFDVTLNCEGVEYTYGG